MEEIRTKGRGGPEPNRELLAHIWIHLSSTKNHGTPTNGPIPVLGLPA